MTSGRHYYRRKAGCFLRYKCFRGVDVTSPGEEAVDPDRMASSAYMGVLGGHRFGLGHGYEHGISRGCIQASFALFQAF